MRRIITASAAVALIAAAVGWMYFQHIPAWYRPVWLSQIEAEAVRVEMEDTFERVSRKMVAGQEFSITFSASQINEMLAAQEVIWPAANPLPHEQFSSACVALDQGELTLGVRYRGGGIESILNVSLAPQLIEEHLCLQVIGVRAGSLPLPARSLVRMWSGEKQAVATRSESLRQSLVRFDRDGGPLLLANTFRWVNGNVPFRITAFEVEKDRLKLAVQPLPG